MNTRPITEADLDAANAARFPSSAPTRTPRRFLISVIKADGGAYAYHRLGGTSIDHTLEASELAGLGGVVRVQPYEQAAAA